MRYSPLVLENGNPTDYMLVWTRCDIHTQPIHVFVPSQTLHIRTREESWTISYGALDVLSEVGKKEGGRLEVVAI